MHLNPTLDCICSFFSPFLALAVATLLVGWVYYSLKTNGLPPGPTGVPFLGYWPFIDHKDTHLQFDALKKKYGAVFSLNITGTLFVNLGSHKAVREAHVIKSDYFADRYEVFNLLTDFFHGGLAFINGEEWQTARSFFTRTMKERACPSDRNSLSDSLYDSINSVVDALRDSAGEPVDIVELLVGHCNRVVRHALFGEHGEVSMEEIRQIDANIAKIVGIVQSPDLLPTGSIAKNLIFPFTDNYAECKAGVVNARKVLYRQVEQHEATYDEENIRDIIDEYIKERNFRRNKGDPTAKYFTDLVLVSTLTQLVADGSTTVAIILGLYVIALLDHPEEQEKIYGELVEVVGVDRQPTIEDKSRLPYTNAFILETLRTKVRLFPYAPKMECTKETTLCGYRIPKGAITLISFQQIHTDPEAYDDPEKFDPTRFISREGKPRPNLPVSFGNGKRVCIGEAFSMLQVFLFVTTLIKNFHISSPNGVLQKDLKKGKLEIVVRPRHHK